MSVSLEALAIAGVDWAEYGKSVEEWEQEDLNIEPPEYLLAEYEEEEDEDDSDHGEEDRDQSLAASGTMSRIIDLGKCMKVLQSEEDDFLESFDAWWSSKRGCLGPKMELKVTLEKLILALKKTSGLI